MDWKNKLGQIQNKVKFQLHATKQDDLSKVYAICEQCDPNHSNILDKVNFNKFLAKCGVFLTSQELREVYQSYDKDANGQIHYMEFLQFIRTSMSEKRLSAVKHAFQFLRKQQNSEQLSLDALLKSYQGQGHPRVLIRDKTQEQVTADFTAAITRRSNEGQVTEEQFLEYYADVNATLPEEKENYFCDLVFRTWGVTSGQNYVSQERLEELQTTLYEKIRQKTLKGQDEGETIKRAFKYFDLNNSRRINIKQFWQAMDKFGCVFSQSEIEALFNKFDTEQSGTLDYQNFANVFATMGSGTNPNVNPVFSLLQQAPTEVIHKIRAVLDARGCTGQSIYDDIKASDKMCNNYLSRHDFTWTLKTNGHSLTKTELDKLFRYFDKNGKDQVDYNAFLRELNSEGKYPFLTENLK